MNERHDPYSTVGLLLFYFYCAVGFVALVFLGLGIAHLV